jgi:hypothetical protein
MSTIVRIISETWDVDKTIKMLEFCRDNPNASEEELLNASVQIFEQHNI